MSSQRMMEAAKLRLRLQMNARLRLEMLAALARVFREYRDPITDDLLSTLILAVPEELLGEAPADPSNGAGKIWAQNNPVPPDEEPLTPIPPPFRPIPPPAEGKVKSSHSHSGTKSRSQRSTRG